MSLHSIVGPPPVRPAAPSRGHLLGRLIGLLVVPPLLLGIAGALLSASRGRVETVAAGTTAHTAERTVELLVSAPLLACGGLVAAWLAGCGLLTLACATRRAVGGRWTAGERLLRRVTPRLARRAVAAALGAGLAFGGTTAHADPAADHSLGWLPSTGATTSPVETSGETSAPISPGPAAAPAARLEVSAPENAPAPSTDLGTAAAAKVTPEPSGDVVQQHGVGVTSPPPEDPASPAAPRTSEPRSAAEVVVRPAEVVVRPGDSLWRIAATRLPASADAGEIARSWPRWHEANRHTIGDDPDVIHPGQVLTVPDDAPAPLDSPADDATGSAR